MRRIICFLITLLSSFWLSGLCAEEAATTFALTTTAFLDQGALPVLYTCDGKDVSPQLSWTNPPAKAQTFVVLLADPDAPNGVFYHWVVYNLPKDTKEIAEGATSLPKGAAVGVNDFGKEQYNGPCPPKGTAHNYILTLYALDGPLKLSGKVDGRSVMQAMKGKEVGSTKLSAVYSRWLK